MPFRPTALERAFELASSGRFTSLSELRLQLIKEGFDGRQVEGRQLSQQLRRLIEAKPDPRDDKGS